MKRYKLVIIAAFAAVIIMPEAGVQAGIFSKDKIGTTSAQFLKLGIGARPVAMGEAYVGLADDVSAIYWNPAGLNLVKGREVSAMHAIWFEEISFSWLAYTQDAFKGKIGFAVNYLTAGEMDSYDNAGESLDSTYTAYDLAVSIAYARVIKSMPVGLNVKLINSRLEDETAFGVAADIGVIKTVSKSKDIKVGLVVQNLGMGLKFIDESDPLPLVIKLGTYFKMLKKKLTLAVDVNFPVDNNINGHIGAEYKHIIGKVSLMPRAGYKTTTINDLDALSGLSGGMGFLYCGLGVDYAWVPYWEFGSTHRISVSYKFGKGN